MALRFIVVGLLLLFGSCTNTVDPVSTKFPGIGEAVPQNIIDREATELSACLGYAVDPSDWKINVVSEMGSDGLFACDDIATPDVAADCGTRPAGCYRNEDCPCRCSGFTFFDDMQIVVTDDYCSIKHEFLHALVGIAGHNEQPEWLCVESCL